MSGLRTIVLRPQKQGTFVARHPWVLERSIVPPTDVPADGEVVELTIPSGRVMGRGIYNSRSHIRVRLYAWDGQAELNGDFWKMRLEQAIELRRRLGFDSPAGATRLVFSEADGLSGLIVDRYGDYLVVQIAALAMSVRVDEIVGILGELVRPKGIVLRTDLKIAQAEGIEPRTGLAWGEAPPERVEIDEHGIRYEVDLGSGQKTGYYLDQRENHAATARYCRDQRVLDMCCYVGGFGLTAAKLGGAREVLGIDSSEKAVEQARKHAERNGIEQAKFETGECFESLERLVEAGEKFGVVVLDPPRFAFSRKGIDQALRAYHRLNRLGASLLEPGGILVTCSCSGRVSRDEFLKMLGGVSQKAGRDIQILEQRGPSPDHPVRTSCPETDYLKCYICRVV